MSDYRCPVCGSERRDIRDPVPAREPNIIDAVIGGQIPTKLCRHESHDQKEQPR